MGRMMSLAKEVTAAHFTVAKAAMGVLVPEEEVLWALLVDLTLNSINAKLLITTRDMTVLTSTTYVMTQRVIAYPQVA